MMIHDVTKLAGKYKNRKRVGRGRGAGGKRAGRGQKGAGSRSGNSRKTAFEGGQMPYFRRLPKVGFSNVNFAQRFWVVNIRQILEHPSFAKGGSVDAGALVDAGLIRDDSRDLKVLGDLGDHSLKVKLDVTANRISASARKAIEEAGGTVSETGTRRDRVRGVDRAGGDLTPTNQTKKLKRYKAKMAAQAAPADEGKGKKKKAKKG